MTDIEQVKEAEKRLFVDMDGTLAEFKEVDTLETLYEEGYFLNLKPNENVISAIKDIIAGDNGIEVYIMSSVLTDSKFALNEKNAWLDKYIPEIDRKHRIYPPCGEDKKDYIPGEISRKDFLLDDYTKNLMLWEPPGMGIKLLNGINDTHKTWQGARVSYEDSHSGLAKKIESMMSQGLKDIHIVKGRSR